MIHLYSLSFSPWSEKARWALDHHRVPYRRHEHPMLIGELRLRVLMRKPRGMITVPVLRDGDRWLTDSFDIARYAEDHGRGASLLPAAHREDIALWNRRSDTVLAAGRAMAVIATLDRPEDLRRFLPGPVPGPVRTLLTPVVRAGLQGFANKYGMLRGSIDDHKQTLIEGLTHLETALADGRYYIFDELSYADIAMAAALQVVKFVDERYMPRFPAARSNDELASRFARLVTWRDALYARHRPPSSAV